MICTIACMFTGPRRRWWNDSALFLRKRSCTKLGDHCSWIDLLRLRRRILTFCQNFHDGDRDSRLETKVRATVTVSSVYLTEHKVPHRHVSRFRHQSGHDYEVQLMEGSMKACTLLTATLKGHFARAPTAQLRHHTFGTTTLAGVVPSQ